MINYFKKYFIGFGIVCLMAAQAWATTVTIQPSSADSYMAAAAPTTNYGSQVSVLVYPWSASIRRGIIQFDLSSIPINATVTSATLELYVYATGGFDYVVNLHRIQQSPVRDWQESSVTWNNYKTGTAWSSGGGDYSSTISGTVIWGGGPPYAKWGTFESTQLVNDVQSFISTPATNFGWLVKGSDEAVGSSYYAYFYSNDEPTQTTKRPKLSITYDVITYIVTNCADSGVGSLRDAINTANGDPNIKNIIFNIPSTEAGYTTEGGVSFWRISPSSALPTISVNNVKIDATTQTTNQGDSNPQGPEIVINGASAGSAHGFNISGSNCTLEGMAINGFSASSYAGVYITGASNKVRGNYIGTTATGEAASANHYGILIYNSGATGNVIGGTTSEARNIISGNNSNGVYIYGTGANSNAVKGNYIGTNVSGTTDLGNTSSGVYINSGPSFNIIGGNTAAARNIISGNNLDGVRIVDAGRNVVSGNYLGTRANGTVPLPNSNRGVSIYNSSTYNIIGGTTEGERNIISGNTLDGIYIFWTGANSNEVKGNYIGTDYTGTADLGNTQNGVNLYGGPSFNIIGGTTAGDRNIISGNNVNGINIYGTESLSNEVKGNYIGTDYTGTVDRGNSWSGVLITAGPKYNIIGGTTAGSRNIISGNDWYGVDIDAANTNAVKGNYIGTNVGGTAALGNTLPGVIIANGAKYNIIGGNTSDERNTLSSNYYGIQITGTNTNSNEVRCNYIGTMATGEGNLGNKRFGIFIASSAQFNKIGLPGTSEGSTIAYNGTTGSYAGIHIVGASTDYNTISHVSMFSNTGLGIDLAGDGANDNLLYPTISLAQYNIVGGQTVVTGTCESNVVSVEVYYVGTTPDPSGYGEGRTFLGATSASGGNWSLSVSGVSSGDSVTALNTDNLGNSSEFALNCVISAINHAPAVTFESISSQYTDGSGYVSFEVRVWDVGGNVTRLQIKYSTDEGTTWGDPWLVSASQDTGSVSLDNAATYQVGNTNPKIATNSGTREVTIVWDTKAATNEFGSLDGSIISTVKLQAVPNDFIIDGEAVTSETFSVDDCVPLGLANFAASLHTQTSITWGWTAVTLEANFNHYEIWYGTNQSDVLNRTGSAAEWDQDNDANLAVMSAHSTQIGGLTEGLTYFAKIWAVDDFGNESTTTESSDAPGVTTIFPLADSFIRESVPGTNYGTDTTLYLHANDAVSQTRRIILKFDLTEIPSTSVISSAKLMIYQNSAGGAAMTVEAHRVDAIRDWTETGVTWNNYKAGNAWTTPGIDYVTTITTTENVPNLNLRWITFEVTADVQTFVSSPSTNEGWMIKYVDEGTQNILKSFHSKEFTDDPNKRPKILLTYTTPTTYTVTKCDDSGVGTLRQAIIDANNNPGPDTIDFNIPNTEACYTSCGTGNVWVIRVDTALPAITDNYTVIDGTTQTLNQGDTNPNGPEIVLTTNEGVAPVDISGINITADHCTLEGITIYGFRVAGPWWPYVGGVRITGDYNHIKGNYIGPACDGESAKGNGHGVYISGGGTGNIIGGTTAAERNVISGNTWWGVCVGDNSPDNTIIGNYIGPDKDGLQDVGNGGYGIYVWGAATSNTIVGGTTSAARNIISGNGYSGVLIGDGTGAQIKGNYIGVDVNGTSILANDGAGVFLGLVSSNTIVGGITEGERNVISGNGDGAGFDDYGIFISVSAGNRILGNYIGTNANGSAAIANNYSGIIIDGATNNIIGSNEAGGRNVISGNNAHGMIIGNSTDNYVMGNYIGVAANGIDDLGNTQDGIRIEGSSQRNVIGGSKSGGYTNVLSGNTLSGISIGINWQARIAGTNEVYGNYIGTTATGEGNVGNSQYGVNISGGSTHNLIGGTITDEGNTIAYNGTAGSYDGVYVTGSTTIYNTISHNSMLSNTDKGIELVSLGNEELAAPAIDSALWNSGTGLTTIEGTCVAGIASVEVFIADTTDDTAYGEGRIFLGAVVPSGTTWTVTVTGATTADVVTATNTDNSGNTSEFSLNRAVVDAGAGYYGVLNTYDSGRNSLRWCMNNAIAAGGNETIWFNIPTTDPGYTTEAGVNFWRISPISALPTMNVNGVHIDATTQVTNQGNVNPFGPEVVVSGTNAGSVNGFFITGSNCTLEGMVINNYSTNGYSGVLIYGANNRIVGNYIGTDATGEAAAANYRGVYSYGAGAINNVIGGLGTTEGNVISGNTNVGIQIIDAYYNVIQNNYIGTNQSGTAALANGSSGIDIYNGNYCVIGGSTLEGRGNNIISGNTYNGVYVAVTSYVTVEGNYIGTDVYGTGDLGNGDVGVFFDTSGAYNIVGGSTPDKRNIISGNVSYGVFLEDVSSCEVKGNYVGVDVTGNTALKNENSGVSIGVNAFRNIIGGLTAGERNIISGNGNVGQYNEYGVRIYNSPNNIVIGNYIGTNWDGTAAVKNEQSGILIDGASATGNIIGSNEAGGRNIISGNDESGIFIHFAPGNRVIGNYIGTDVNGTADLGNNSAGVNIQGNTAISNIVGGKTTAERNVISGNNDNGMFIGNNWQGYAAGSCEVYGNYIGVDKTGLIDLGNTNYGIFIYGAGATNNIIGTSEAGGRNVISGNSLTGIFISGGANYHYIRGNYIGTTATGEGNVGNSQMGLYLTGGAHHIMIGGPTTYEGNVIAYNGTSGSFDGIYLSGAATDYNTITHNSIFSNTDLGIDLAGDGANDDLLYPTISTAGYYPDSGETHISGTCESNVVSVEVYNVGVTPDPSGYGEGQTFLGVASASGGTWSIVLNYAGSGETISAINTDNLGNTSEFALNFVITGFSGKHYIIEDGIKQKVEIGGQKRKVYER
ncbi:MAG: DNRLRE domain-containing protein [Candidatus Margulisbacteria bacterium]|nr:DNRLRE domain-containing protein [Candidatus Margulisiibacteriota bacterium]MBU1728897.1 DNRLRE domain-containing protein [Candidatus Margulisiibacteriota bacterium]MBU1955529.1 DNRLRE domain-containing protein [Candidatus Margulisiibacteriota bacterium]